jgi:hypothetical protein
MSTKLPDDGLPAPDAVALAVALERAAAAVARLAMALAGHPLAAAWAYRARLDAVRRQAAADGLMIDPWHLAALVDAARHALALYQWSSRPDNAQQADGMGACRTRRSSVLRLAANPSLAPRRTPAEPPSAKPRAMSRASRRRVRRAQGRARSGRRSAKMRRAQRAFRQNRRRTAAGR